MELRAGCEDGDRRACVRLGILIGEYGKSLSRQQSQLAYSSQPPRRSPGVAALAAATVVVGTGTVLTPCALDGITAIGGIAIIFTWARWSACAFTCSKTTHAGIRTTPSTANEPTRCGELANACSSLSAWAF